MVYPNSCGSNIQDPISIPLGEWASCTKITLPFLAVQDGTHYISFIFKGVEHLTSFDGIIGVTFLIYNIFFCLDIYLSDKIIFFTLFLFLYFFKFCNKTHFYNNIL